MATKIQVPVTSASAKPIVVPDHFELSDNLQLAFQVLGDGFFNLIGKIGSRTLKEMNGEVIPGTGMQIKVRDYAALVDGTVLDGTSNGTIKLTSMTTLAVSGFGIWWVVLTPAKVSGPDVLKRPDWSKGVLSLSRTKPAAHSGSLTVAKLTIPNATTQILANMIDNSARQYLADLEDIAASVAALASAGGGGSDVSGVNKLAQLIINLDFFSMMTSQAYGVGKGMFTDGFQDIYGPNCGFTLTDRPSKEDAGLSSQMIYTGLSPTGNTDGLSPAPTSTTIEAESNTVAKSAGWSNVIDAGASAGRVELATTAGATLTLPFSGIEIRAILPLLASGGATFTASIDGGAPVSFTQDASQVAAPQDQYDMPLFSGLPNGNHTLVLTSGAQSAGGQLVDSFNGNSLPTAQGWTEVFNGGAIQSVSGGRLTVSNDAAVHWTPPVLPPAPCSRTEFIVSNLNLAVNNSYIYLTWANGRYQAFLQSGYGYFYDLLNPAGYIFNVGGAYDSNQHSFKWVADSSTGLAELYVDNVLRASVPGVINGDHSGAVEFTISPQLGTAISLSGITLNFSSTISSVNKIDAFKTLSPAASGALVSNLIPFNLPASSILVDADIAPNGGTITYDVLSADGTTVLVSGITLDAFRNLPASVNGIRLRANFTGGAVLERWGCVAK